MAEKSVSLIQKAEQKTAEKEFEHSEMVASLVEEIDQERAEKFNQMIEESEKFIVSSNFILNCSPG